MKGKTKRGSTKEAEGILNTIFFFFKIPFLIVRFLINDQEGSKQDSKQAKEIVLFSDSLVFLN